MMWLYPRPSSQSTQIELLEFFGRWLHLNCVSASNSFIEIYGRCGESILLVEVPFFQVLAGEHVADLSGARVPFIFTHISALTELITMDLAKSELMRVLSTISFPSDVWQTRKCSSKCECSHWHGGVQWLMEIRGYSTECGLR